MRRALVLCFLLVIATISVSSTYAGQGSPTGGQIPRWDVTTFEGVPGTTCFNPKEEINGTISSSSNSLTLASAGTFRNQCYVGLAGAGPSTSLSTPSIASATFSPSTVKIAAAGISIVSNVATLTLLNDASFNVGDVVTVANATGCAAGMNGTHTVSGTSFPGTSGNKFTFSFTAANGTCGGSNADGTAGSTSGTTITPATVVASAGSTTYKYIVSAMDFLNGQTALTAATTITTGPSSLIGNESIKITVNCATGAASYPVYRQTASAGNYVYIGSALPCPTGYTTTTTTIQDFGQNPPTPLNVATTASPSGSAVGQILISQITSGGGTTTLTLAAAASNSVTSHIVYHDNTTAFNLALAASHSDAGSSTEVFVPPTVFPRVCGLNLTYPTVGMLPMKIVIAGGLMADCTIHRIRGEYSFIGIGGSGGVQFTGGTQSVIATGNLSPTFFDEADQPSELSGFVFGDGVLSSFPRGNAQGTAVYVGNALEQLYTNISTGGNQNAYSPGFYINGATGTGADFSETLINPKFIGSTNYPVPSFVADSANVSWFRGFMGQRGAKFLCSLSLASGGGLFLRDVTTEAIHDSYAFVTDFTNCANLGGVYTFGGTYADGFYVTGAIFNNIVTSNSGTLVAQVVDSTGHLVEGAPYTDANVQGIGEGDLGAQSLSYHQGPLTAQFGADDPTHGGINISRGYISAGFSQARNTGDTHHFVDPTNGGNGTSFSVFSPGAFFRLDSAYANSSVQYEGPSSGTQQIYMSTPTGATQLFSDSANHAFTLTHTGGAATAKISLWGTTAGGFPSAPFAVLNGPLLFSNDGTSTNYVEIVGTPTSNRVATFQDASGTVSFTNVTNHSGTITAATHIVQDTATLAAGTVTVTLTGGGVFSGATTYTCQAVDTTTATHAVTITQTSGSSITFAGTGTDAVSYSCIGH